MLGMRYNSPYSCQFSLNMRWNFVPPTVSSRIFHHHHASSSPHFISTHYLLIDSRRAPAKPPSRIHQTNFQAKSKHHHLFSSSHRPSQPRQPSSSILLLLTVNVVSVVEMVGVANSAIHLSWGKLTIACDVAFQKMKLLVSSCFANNVDGSSSSSHSTL